MLRYYPPVETHLLHARHVRQTFKIQVMRPVALRDAPRESLPVVYVTDGNFFFDIFKGVAQIMQSLECPASRFILVGIGYPGDSPYAGALLRGRDLMFPGYPQLNAGRVTADLLPIDGVLTAAEGEKDFGAADDFQDFLAEELFPFVEQTYGASPDNRIYFGHSAGGGFGFYTLLTRSRLFSNYVLSSPGLSFHGVTRAGVAYDRYDFLFDRVRDFAASGRTLDGVRLRLSVGDEEEFEPAYAQFRLTSSVYRMHALLREVAIPGLRFDMEVFPGENHATAPLPAFTRAMRAFARDAR